MLIKVSYNRENRIGSTLFTETLMLFKLKCSNLLKINGNALIHSPMFVETY